MRRNGYRQAFRGLLSCAVTFIALASSNASTQELAPEQRMLVIEQWASSNKSMLAALESAINEPANIDARDFAREALDMSWYDLDDSGVLPFLKSNLSMDPGLWHEKANQLEALYTGCLFPRWALAWKAKKPAEDAFGVWMDTPETDVALSTQNETAMETANDIYYAARSEAQDCVDGGKLDALTY
jgi:hypothetical protein